MAVTLPALKKRKRSKTKIIERIAPGAALDEERAKTAAAGTTEVKACLWKKVTPLVEGKGGRMPPEKEDGYGGPHWGEKSCAHRWGKKLT